MVESKLQHFANYDRYIIHLMSRTAMCKCTAAISNHTIHTCTHTHTKHTDVGNEIDTWYMWKPKIISKLMKQLTSENVERCSSLALSLVVQRYETLKSSTAWPPKFSTHVVRVKLVTAWATRGKSPVSELSLLMSLEIFLERVTFWYADLKLGWWIRAARTQNQEMASGSKQLLIQYHVSYWIWMRFGCYTYYG